MNNVNANVSGIGDLFHAPAVQPVENPILRFLGHDSGLRSGDCGEAFLGGGGGP